MDKNLQTDILRLLALLFCVIFLLGAVAGDSARLGALAPSEGGESFNPDEILLGIDTVAAMETYAPDTVMLSSDDLVITWGLFYYILYNTAAQVTYGFQDPLDWSEMSPYGGTWGDMVKDYVIEQTTQILVFLYGADVNGLYITEDELEEIQEVIDMMIAEAGSVENLERDLREGGFYNLSVYEELMKSFSLQEKLPVSLYGNNLDEISDEIVAEFAAREGFMRAKHILRMFPTEDSEKTKEDVYAEIEDILAQLNERIDDEDFLDVFYELEKEYSEDRGRSDYPDGYLFQQYDMMTEFFDACAELQLGQISGIVETGYGYHIILRLPLDYDNIVPVSVASQGQNYNLRQLAVFEDFDNMYFMWLDSLDIKTSQELDTLDIATLFAWR